MELITKRICMTKNLGIQQNLFGGEMLSWLDEAAAIFVSEKIESPNIVTLEFEKTTFKVPVKEGNIIKIYGKITNVGTTSVTIYLEARRYDSITAEEVLVCCTGAKFVRIDENNKAIAISEKAKQKLTEELK